MPLTLIFYVVGGISISGFPLFSGFVSKSMIVAGAGEAHHPVLMVTAASGLGGHFPFGRLEASILRLVWKRLRA